MSVEAAEDMEGSTAAHWKLSDCHILYRCVEVKCGYIIIVFMNRWFVASAWQWAKSVPEPCVAITLLPLSAHEMPHLQECQVLKTAANGLLSLFLTAVNLLIIISQSFILCVKHQKNWMPCSKTLAAFLWALRTLWSFFFYSLQIVLDRMNQILIIQRVILHSSPMPRKWMYSSVCSLCLSYWLNRDCFAMHVIVSFCSNLTCVYNVKRQIIISKPWSALVLNGSKIVFRFGFVLLNRFKLLCFGEHVSWEFA